MAVAFTGRRYYNMNRIIDKSIIVSCTLFPLSIFLFLFFFFNYLRHRGNPRRATSAVTAYRSDYLTPPSGGLRCHQLFNRTSIQEHISCPSFTLHTPEPQYRSYLHNENKQQIQENREDGWRSVHPGARKVKG